MSDEKPSGVGPAGKLREIVERVRDRFGKDPWNMDKGRSAAIWSLGLAVLFALAGGTVLIAVGGGESPKSALHHLPTATGPKFSPQPDTTWMADAEVAEARTFTDPGLGAAQGIAVRDGKVYAYGDGSPATPRVGVIREYDLELSPTGREVRLSRDGDPLVIHPAGLTWDPRFGTFLGDTFLKKAVIYRLDWDRAWADQNLDHAVLATIDDDAAINGCRPSFVEVGGRALIATADCGDLHPEFRLYDPEAMLKAGRTSAPGVVVHRVLCGPYNQNLYWDSSTRRLTCVQNVIETRGWRLDVLDLDRAVGDGRASGPEVRVETLTFPSHDELEGYWPLDGQRSLFITSSPSENIILGVVRPTSPRTSLPGSR